MLASQVHQSIFLALLIGNCFFDAPRFSCSLNPLPIYCTQITPLPEIINSDCELIVQYFHGYEN